MMDWLRTKIFLVDSLGAIVTALGVGVLLPFLEIGVPEKDLHTLAFVAIGFSLYSGACFLLKASPWPWLAVIAVANLSYCGLTAFFVWPYFEQLTTLGLLYFINEFVVVTIVSAVEFEIIRQS